jgi:hypothetical protein
MARQTSEKVVFLLALFAAFASCKSTPKPEDFYAGRADPFALMAQGADIYLRADAKEARPILDSIKLSESGGKEIAEFLDLTDTVTASLWSAKEIKKEQAKAEKEAAKNEDSLSAGLSKTEEAPPLRRFLVAADGKYPSKKGKFYFGASADWKKTKSATGLEYYRSEKANLSINLAAAKAYISDGDPFVPAPGASAPAELAALQQNADGKPAVLYGWMDDPDTPFNKIISTLKLPVTLPADRLLFGVYQAEAAETFTAALRLETSKPSQAAAVARIFSLAKGALSLFDFSGRKDGESLGALLKILFAGTPETDGSAVIVRTGTISAKDIALLFNTLAVHSN